MKTFIVLIPLDENNSARTQCELIEGYKFEIGGSVQATALDVKKNVIELINEPTFNLDNIEVEPLTDFMDRANNQELNLKDYFISYVHA